jgi:hypothetical protein
MSSHHNPTNNYQFNPGYGTCQTRIRLTPAHPCPPTATPLLADQERERPQLYCLLSWQHCNQHRERLLPAQGQYSKQPVQLANCFDSNRPHRHTLHCRSLGTTIATGGECGMTCTFVWWQTVQQPEPCHGHVATQHLGWPEASCCQLVADYCHQHFKTCSKHTNHKKQLMVHSNSNYLVHQQLPINDFHLQIRCRDRSSSVLRFYQYNHIWQHCSCC